MKLRGFFATLLLFGVLCLGAGFYTYFWLPTWGARSITLSQATVIDFPRGTPLRTLSQKLEEAELIDNLQLFNIWVRYFSDYSQFQAGNYRFKGEVSAELIAQKLIHGETFVPVVFEYTIPEGFTLHKTIASLVAKGVGTEAEFADLLANRKFFESVRITGTSLEGYLYPATYPFTSFPTPREALVKPIETFWDKLPADYLERINALSLTLDQAVAMASLIELETPFHDERSLVSEVIWRRLNRNIPLAIDAAIIYGISDYKGNLRRKHLDDASNPYNTRIHAGLPPTPIGSPSLLSLKAVLTPATNDYLYYVLDIDTGKHHFSKTLREHNRYVRKLVKDSRKRPGR